MKQNLIQLPENPLGLRIYNIEPAAIQRRLNAINGRLDALDFVAKAEGREYTEAELDEIERLTVEHDTLAAALPNKGRAAAAAQPSTGIGHHPATGGYAPGASADTWGFPTAGHFAVAVRDAARPGGGNIDPRLVQNAPTTISTEGTGADGGFAVPPKFKSEIWQKVGGEDSLLALTDNHPTPSNQIVVPADEGEPWASTGPQGYWEGEAGQITQSKVALKQKTIRLNKLTALVPVTEELMEDAPGLDAYLRRKVGTIFDYKVNKALIQGTGAGEPLGFLNAACLKSVAKGDGQSADTIIYENITSMFAAMDPAAVTGAIWIANPTCLPQLLSMEYPTTSGQVLPAFLAGNNLAGRPFATLLGLPIRFSFACPTLGDQGDISLVNLKQYMTAIKAGGIRTDVSMHLWFDYDVLAYRFILRVAGQPWPAAVMTAPDGSNTFSPFVCVDERGEG